MKSLELRCAAVLLMFASSGAIVFGADAGSDPDAPHTDIRKELLSEFKYVKVPKDPSSKDAVQATASADPSPAARAAGDSAPIVMAPFSVKESADMKRLQQDLQMQKADATREMTMSKLGIGVHVAPVGPGGFYVVTVFYIPIAVGFGISF